MLKPLVVIGGGGHAKVVISAARASGREVVAVLDSNESRWGEDVSGVVITGGLETASDWLQAEFIIAVGDNSARSRIAQELDVTWGTLVHPSAWVDERAKVGQGSVVMAGCVVQPDVEIGRHAILNTGATVDHDGKVGDFVHIGPGSHLSGGVKVGEGTLLGVGSSVRPRIEIGQWALLGAGSAAVTHLEPYGVYGGVPAKLLKNIHIP